jgi:hypothetical protein
MDIGKHNPADRSLQPWQIQPEDHSAHNNTSIFIDHITLIVRVSRKQAATRRRLPNHPKTHPNHIFHYITHSPK